MLSFRRGPCFATHDLNPTFTAHLPILLFATRPFTPRLYVFLSFDLLVSGWNLFGWSSSGNFCLPRTHLCF